MLSASTKKAAAASASRRWLRRPRSSSSAIVPRSRTTLRSVSTTASVPRFASIPYASVAASLATTAGVATVGLGCLLSLRDRLEAGVSPSSDVPLVDLDDVWVLRRVVVVDEDAGREGQTTIVDRSSFPDAVVANEDDAEERSKWFNHSQMLPMESTENDFEFVPPEADEYVHPLLATSA